MTIGGCANTYTRQRLERRFLHYLLTGEEDGVTIRHDGQIPKGNNARLDERDGSTIPWLIFSNDPQVINKITYEQSSDKFNYGDPEYQAHGVIEQAKDIFKTRKLETKKFDYLDERDAPWKRSEWDSPDLPQ